MARCWRTTCLRCWGSRIRSPTSRQWLGWPTWCGLHPAAPMRNDDPNEVVHPLLLDVSGPSMERRSHLLGSLTVWRRRWPAPAGLSGQPQRDRLDLRMAHTPARGSRRRRHRLREFVEPEQLRPDEDHDATREDPHMLTILRESGLCGCPWRIAKTGQFSAIFKI